MQSVKLTISGSYWDSQIYSGELLLLDDQGAIHRVDWRSAIDAIAVKNQVVQTALRVAFSDSDLFYNEKVRKILRDPIIENPIKSQLNSLSQIELDVDAFHWRAFWRTDDTPFKFLPTDTDIYYNHLFAGGEAGLFSAPRTGLEKGKLFDEKVRKHHDAGVLQVKASDRYTAIATATGGDGLFEFAFKKDEKEILQNSRLVTGRPCSACDWAFQNLVGWTNNSAFIASFTEDKGKSKNKTERILDRIVDISEVFGDQDSEINESSFSWGSRDKIYRVTNSGIEVSDHHPNNKKSSHTKNFEQIGHFEVGFKPDSVISTGTAPFGTVLEFDDHILVLRSDGIIEKFEDEPVHWRIFPRSEHYSNQLHIIYDERIEIISFVHDYFVDQQKKLNGFTRGK